MGLVSKVRLFIPQVREVPPELMKKWMENYYAKARQISAHRRKSVGTVKDFQEKVVKPLMKGTAQYMSPNFHSRSGLSAKYILMKQRKSLEKAGRKYLKGLDQAFRTVDGVKAKKIKDKLEYSAQKYAWGMAELWTLIGRSPSGAKGPVVLAQLWLTGDKTVRDFLGEEDEILKGGPILVPKPDLIKAFKTKLNRRLIQAGNIIKGYISTDRPEYPVQPCMEEENEQTNALVQLFARPGFIPFAPGGPSHLDFRIKEIPEPTDPDKTIKQLYLDIQVAQA